MFFKKEKRNDTLEKQISYWNHLAIDYALSFEKIFDYSVESLSSLEDILEYYHQDMTQSAPTEEQIWSMACIFGSYLGEVFVRQGLQKKGYLWSLKEGSDIPVLAKGKTFIAPIDKVYKRLYNGSEDHIVSFYDVVIDMER